VICKNRSLLFEGQYMYINCSILRAICAYHPCLAFHASWQTLGKYFFKYPPLSALADNHPVKPLTYKNYQIQIWSVYTNLPNLVTTGDGFIHTFPTWWLLGMGFPIFRQVEITIDFVESGTSIQLHIKRHEPRNLISTTSPLVINLVTIRLTSLRRLKNKLQNLVLYNMVYWL